jgi:hypothetical protein
MVATGEARIRLGVRGGNPHVRGAFMAGRPPEDGNPRPGPASDVNEVVVPIEDDLDGGITFHYSNGAPMRPVDVTPLEEHEPEGTIPASPLWAMKERRHEQLFHFGHPHRVREAVGSGDAAVYVMDDGPHHRMIGRRVGQTQDGAVYSLVARVKTDVITSLASGSLTAREAFRASSEAGLVGTAEAPGVSNVFDIDNYDAPTDIPEEYLPPAPFRNFETDLPTATN